MKKKPEKDAKKEKEKEKAKGDSSKEEEKKGKKEKEKKKESEVAETKKEKSVSDATVINLCHKIKPHTPAQTRHFDLRCELSYMAHKKCFWFTVQHV